VATIIFVRIGPPNSDQANISQGGHPQDPQSVFEDYKDVIKVLRKEALEAFNLLGQAYALCEIAFDFLKDTEGNNWLIEINARPGTKGPRTLREWVIEEKTDLYARNGVILFDEKYTNERRRKWGERFQNFKSFPFLYAIHLSEKI
jgi:hypothetical protein